MNFDAWFAGGGDSPDRTTHGRSRGQRANVDVAPDVEQDDNYSTRRLAREQERRGVPPHRAYPIEGIPDVLGTESLGPVFGCAVGRYFACQWPIQLDHAQFLALGSLCLASGFRTRDAGDTRYWGVQRFLGMAAVIIVVGRLIGCYANLYPDDALGFGTWFRDEFLAGMNLDGWARYFFRDPLDWVLLAVWFFHSGRIEPPEPITKPPTLWRARRVPPAGHPADSASGLIAFLPVVAVVLAPRPEGAIGVLYLLAFAAAVAVTFGFAAGAEFADYAAARSRSVARRFSWRRPFSDRRYLALEYLGDSLPKAALPLLASTFAALSLGHTPFAGMLVVSAFAGTAFLIAPAGGPRLVRQVVGVVAAYNTGRAAAPGFVQFSPALRNPEDRMAWIAAANAAFAVAVFHLQTISPMWPDVQRTFSLDKVLPPAAASFDYTSLALAVLFQAIAPAVLFRAALVAAYAARWGEFVRRASS